MKQTMKESWVCRIGLTLAVLLIAIIPVHADIVTVPEGLSLGDQYRLIFVTSQVTSAVSPMYIDYYNFVNNNVNVHDPDPLTDLGATWEAIVSNENLLEWDQGPYWITHASEQTQTRPNAPGDPDVPIYDLGGNLVASGNAQLWGTTNVATLESPIGINREGEDYSGLVWTGTRPDGLAAAGNGWGNQALGADWDCGTDCGNAMVGSASATNWDWVSADDYARHDVLPLYAISEPLTVVPVPAAIWLLGSGLAALLVFRRKGRKA
jgi:hypothetical protein